MNDLLFIPLWNLKVRLCVLQMQHSYKWTNKWLSLGEQTWEKMQFILKMFCFFLTCGEGDLRGKPAPEISPRWSSAARLSCGKEPLLLHIKINQLRWFKHLIRTPFAHILVWSVLTLFSFFFFLHEGRHSSLYSYLLLLNLKLCVLAWVSSVNSSWVQRLVLSCRAGVILVSPTR